MEFLFDFLFLVFMLCVIFMGEKHPNLYLTNAIIVIIVAVSDFTASGHDYVNNIWGIVMLGLAYYWTSQYIKYRKYRR